MEIDVDSFEDPVIEAYKKDVDRTLLIENLKLTYSQRLDQLQAHYDAFWALRGAARAPKP